MPRFDDASGQSQSQASQRAERRCARGEHCLDARHDDTNGGTVAEWADGGGAFCGRDRNAIARTLSGVPERYVHLRTVIGLKPRGGDDKVTMSRTPPVPVRLDVDALIRDMVVITVSWHERVAAQARLSFPDGRLSLRRRDERAIPAAVAALVPRLDALLALEPLPMVRYLPIRFRRGAPPEIPGLQGTSKPGGFAHPHAGYAEADLDLDGTAAGLEILHLDYRCRKVLGQTLPPPVKLDGIPCWKCETLALEVAPEPQYRSACSACGHLMTPLEYRDWTRKYKAWARAQVIAGEIEPADPAAFAKLAA